MSLRLVLTIMAVVTIAEIAFYLALPKLLSLRGVEVLRRSLTSMTMVFETPDEDGTPVRLLNVNGTFQSASYISDELWSELVCPYHRSMVDVIDEMGDARTVLVIGGGGYSLPKFLITHTKRMRVCVVEIDPEITDIARRRFFLDRAESLSGGRLELVCADGWKWLREEGRRFDVIINDAFKGSKPMGDLDTAEGARLIASRLTDRGVYLANIRCPLEGRRSRVLERTREVFETEFKNVHVIAECSETPRSLGDNVLVATNRALGDDAEQKTAVGA